MKTRNTILSLAALLDFGAQAHAATLQIQLTGSNYNDTTGTWSDTSGNGNDATRFLNSAIGSGTTTTGQTSVVFNGSNAFNLVDLSGFNAAGGEAFVVVKRAANSSTTGNGLWKLGTPGSSNHYTFSDNKIYDDFGNSTRRASAAQSSFDFTEWHVYNVRSLSGEWASLINNQGVTSNTSNTVAFAAAPSLGFSSAPSVAFGSGFKLEGEIAEFRFYSGSMTAGERDAIYNSLNSTFIIPEPSSLALIGLTGLALLLRRRR